MEDTLKKLVDVIAQSVGTVFFGGAGVSTSSGLKDYRSADGLYCTVKSYGVPPEVILSNSFFHKNPEIFWDFYIKYMYSPDAKPNKAHIALAELENMNLLNCIITQNIDGLHQKAGSKNVIELHGSTSRYYCSKCGELYMPESDEITEVLSDALCEKTNAELKIPKCKKCSGVIRPDVVLYEEPLDDIKVQKSIEAISSADVLVIGGTSLNVYPAAGLIKYFHGNKIVIINKGQTSLDHIADILIRDNISDVFEALEQKLKLYFKGKHNGI